MQTPKASKTGQSEKPQKVSPQAAQQLKTPALEINSPSSSSSQASKTPKGRSPKAVERKSPRSPVIEHQKKPTRVSDLESRISQLQAELKGVKDQLTLSETCKRQAQQDADDYKKDLHVMCLKFEECQQQLQALSTSEEIQVRDLLLSSAEPEQASQFKPEAVKEHDSHDSAALTSAMNEIQQLKVELETIAESEAAQLMLTDLAHTEIERIEESLAESLSLLGSMECRLKDCEESEAKAQAVVSEALLQLEAAKKSIGTLSSDSVKVRNAYSSISSELNQSRARVYSLEELLQKLKVDAVSTGANGPETPSEECKVSEALGENPGIENPNQTKLQFDSMKSEIEHLRSALEAAEIRSHEEQNQSALDIKRAYEVVEEIKSKSCLKEIELQAEVKNLQSEIDQLRAHLMDKETELQGIVEENEGLNMKLGKKHSSERECELQLKLKESDNDVAGLKADLMDKETELQNILDENETLRSDIRRREANGRKTCEEAIAVAEKARSAEREALMKLGLVMEEAEKSIKKASRVAEQLETTQALNTEMETELRKLKVQSNQWRKAAEAAASMLSASNNGKLMERTTSLDSNYNEITGTNTSPYEDIDYDSPRKKNGNVLKKIGVLWKKPQK